jgi:hypothetical protein
VSPTDGTWIAWAHGRWHLVPLGGAFKGQDRPATLVLADRTVTYDYAFVSPSNGWSIWEIDSICGVFVNGIRIQGSRGLSDGDRITIGAHSGVMVAVDR